MTIEVENGYTTIEDKGDFITMTAIQHDSRYAIPLHLDIGWPAVALLASELQTMVAQYDAMVKRINEGAQE